ncbi:dTMP kinase [bacterium]|nr:dTMP kinase [bacterium]
MQEKRENIFKDLLITFEGIDGSGKSVQARKLLANLRFRGFSAILVRDPGGPVISEKIRELLLQSEKGSVDSVAELMLYEAARAQLLAEKILPAFSAGNIVISDRFTDSTLAYQGYGRKLPLDAVLTANSLVCGDVKPAVTFILDISLEESLRRREKTVEADDRIEKEKEGFFRDVIAGYKTIAEQEPGRVIMLDGNLAVEKLEQIILGNVLNIIESEKL